MTSKGGGELEAPARRPERTEVSRYDHRTKQIRTGIIRF